MKLVCNRDFKNWDGISDELTYGKVYDILPNRMCIMLELVINITCLSIPFFCITKK